MIFLTVTNIDLVKLTFTSHTFENENQISESYKIRKEGLTLKTYFTSY